MIVGFSLQEVQAKKHHPGQGNINVNFSSTIEDVEEADIPAIDETAARIWFSFPITYRQQEEDIAEITFKGAVLWQQDVEEILEQWEEDETLDDAVSAAVTNHIFRKCLTRAVGLAESLDLPSPVPMPQIGQN